MGTGISRFGSVIAAAALATSVPAEAASQPPADSPPVTRMDGGRQFEMNIGTLTEIAPASFADARLTRDYFEIPAAASATGRPERVDVPQNLVFIGDDMMSQGDTGDMVRALSSRAVYLRSLNRDDTMDDARRAALVKAAQITENGMSADVLNATMLMTTLANGRIAPGRTAADGTELSPLDIVEKMGEIANSSSSAHLMQFQTENGRTAQNGAIVVLERDLSTFGPSATMIKPEFLSIRPEYQAAVPSFVTLHEINHTQDPFAKRHEHGENVARSEFLADSAILNRFSPGFQQFVFDVRAVAALHQRQGLADTHQSHMGIIAAAEGRELSDTDIGAIREANNDILRIAEQEILANTALSLGKTGVEITKVENGYGRTALIQALNDRGAFESVPAGREMIAHYLTGIDRLTTPEYKAQVQDMRAKIEAGFAATDAINVRALGVAQRFDRSITMEQFTASPANGGFSPEQRQLVYTVALGNGAFDDDPRIKAEAVARIMRNRDHFDAKTNARVDEALRQFNQPAAEATTPAPAADMPVAAAPVTGTVRAYGTDPAASTVTSGGGLSAVQPVTANFNPSAARPAPVQDHAHDHTHDHGHGHAAPIGRVQRADRPGL